MDVTFDTGVMIVDRGRNSQLKTIMENGLDLNVKWCSVSKREDKKGFNNVSDSMIVAEEAVWSETPWGEGLWSNSSREEDFESVLKIISSGSFPKKGQREGLPDGHTHHLRDAMIFTAHIRERRDIFVTTDKKGFIGKDDRKRRKLENKFNTVIMTYDEFIEFLGRKNV